MDLEWLSVRVLQWGGDSVWNPPSLGRLGYIRALVIIGVFFLTHNFPFLYNQLTQKRVLLGISFPDLETASI
jgi:hypothetical protein